MLLFMIYKFIPRDYNYYKYLSIINYYVLTVL